LLVDLLSEIGAGGLRVFCTSTPGFDVPPGAEFVTYIKDILSRSELVVNFITPAFLQSDFCMLELGAAWAQGKAFPILAPSLTPDDMRASPLASLQLPTPGDGLDKLRDRVSNLLNVPAPTAGWADRRSRALGYIEAALDRSVPRQINRLAALGVRGHHLEIWALRSEGTISHSWWHDDGGHWRSARDFSAPSGAVDIAVSSRGPEHAEVFIVDDSGALWHKWWSPEQSWSPGWSKFADDVAGPLTACSYEDGHIEIFAIRKSTGSIVHWWSLEAGRWSDSATFYAGLENV
jgi:hypothetical protein